MIYIFFDDDQCNSTRPNMRALRLVGITRENFNEYFMQLISLLLTVAHIVTFFGLINTKVVLKGTDSSWHCDTQESKGN
jgi:hypothetical protein